MAELSSSKYLFNYFVRMHGIYIQPETTKLYVVIVMDLMDIDIETLIHKNKIA